MLTTDASGSALGAVLSQQYDDGERPVAFASRALNDAEIGYSTVEREFLAIVWATAVFRCYLLGRPFTVHTDHKPLKGIANLKDQTSRLAKFRHKLSEYDFTIEYKPGKNNEVADALSRLPMQETEVNVVTRSKAKEIVQEAERENKSDTTELTQYTTTTQNKSNKAEVATPTTRLENVLKLTNKEDIENVIKAFHDSPIRHCTE